MHNYLKSKRWMLPLVLLCFTTAEGAWEKGTGFRIDPVNGKPCLIAPDGQPVKSVGLVWAYGPERGPGLTVERLTNTLQQIKDLGFNTLNLYGDQFIPEMLAWCDEHELAVYFRTAYYSLADFPGALNEYPDFMDPALLESAKKYYKDKYLDAIRNHPSVLAIDMDHRWLFPLDWGGATRIDIPKLRPKTVAHFPKWLAERYGDIGSLNAAWKTQYGSFDDVLQDKALMEDGAFRKIKEHPARVDLYRYVRWVPVHFLRQLAEYLHTEAPGVLITPTTEHPECIPDTNPRPEDGIAFMSPVHYNGVDDYQRDLPGLCKLVYETRWHYDLQRGPVYISETGFRTSTLEQKPPFTLYAWSDPPNEETTARMYAQEFSLLNLLPWIGGYGYFKMYDKWLEGDFGYLQDDGTKKPMAYVGDAINTAFDTAAMEDPEPEVWIYYPEYAHASHRPGFQQLKSMVAVLEKPFFDRMNERIDQYWEDLRAGDPGSGRRYAAKLTRDFEKLWKGFAFTETIPQDDKPVILLSTISELLSAENREVLMKKKTITFGAVGVCNEYMRPIRPWYLEALGLDESTARERFVRLNLADGSAVPLSASDSPSPWDSIQAREYEPAIPCRGQSLDLTPARYTRLEFLAGAVDGNAAPFCTVEYANGVTSKKAMGPTISDMRFKPIMTDGVAWNDRFLSRIAIPLEPQQELKRIVFPDASWVRLFGAVLVKGGVASNTIVSLPGRRVEYTGSTPWCLSLPAESLEPSRAFPDREVLQSLSSGDPAIVAAGPHVAYLYDPLTWSGSTNELSRFTDVHRDAMEKVFSYLRGVEIHE